MDSALLATVPGAVAAVGLDEGTALHYGQPLIEQRQLAQAKACVDFSNKAVLRLRGSQAQHLLHVLSSQDFSTGSNYPASTETLFLDVNGRIEYAPKVLVVADEEVLLICEAAEAEPLMTWLESMKFMLDVQISDQRQHYAPVLATAEVPCWAEDPCWVDPWPQLGAGGYSYSEAQPHPGEDYQAYIYLLPREELAQRITESGLALAGAAAAEALRIAACRPRWGAEIDARTIPHELDWLRTAVHLNKGCYRGQETVARVHNLGHPPRRLVLLHIDGSQHTLVSSGDEVKVATQGGEKVVGVVSSAALHYEMGQIALAVIRRAVDTTATLIVEHHSAGQATEKGTAEPGTRYAAAQEVVVSPAAGQVVGRPSGIRADRTPHRDLRR